MIDTKKAWADMYDQLYSKAEEIGDRLCDAKTRVKCIERNIVYESLSQAAKDNNCSKSHVSAVCNGRLKSAKGLHFEFVDEKDIEVRKDKQPTKQRKSVKRVRISFSKQRYKEVTWSNQKPIYCWTTGESYKSVSEASREIGISRSTILSNCKANSKEGISEDNFKHTSTGYVFLFDEEGWC